MPQPNFFDYLEHAGHLFEEQFRRDDITVEEMWELVKLVTSRARAAAALPKRRQARLRAQLFKANNLVTYLAIFDQALNTN